MTNDYSDEIGQVDLTNCDREPIHQLGHVQSFGCLIAVSSDWLVKRASLNIKDHLGLSPEEIIGTPLSDWLRPECIHTFRTRLQFIWGSPDAVERVFESKVLQESDQAFDVGLHESNGAIILEFEPSSTEDRKDQVSIIRPMIDRIKTQDNLTDICQYAARHVRALTGFDRVMVYKFHPDDTGEVIAESAVSGLDPFLGLRYPATDIPKQARELYQRNLIRIIADVNDKVSPIIPEQTRDDGPLDLSLSGVRAVSPIHLEYLRNMGVGASLSISILRRGKLWGLFACHHYEPRVLRYDIRTAAELFGQMFSFVLDQVLSDLEKVESIKARALHDQLMGQLAEGDSLLDNFETISDALRSVIAFDGACIWVDGQFRRTGLTPSEEEFKNLARHLNTKPTSQVFSTDCISKNYAEGEQFVSRAAGMLVLPVSRNPRDYIILFRKELHKQVNWAGNPEKPVTVGPNGTRLTPRQSFATWKQVVKGCSESWTPGEIAAADSLRVTLLEVVLRISDAANRERAQSQERQELLIAELNHRVRNILNLIRGLVSQSKSEARTVSEFTEIVGGRIHALARAHDQLTQENWSMSSLRDLIRTEAQAYLGDKGRRLEITGPGVLINPAAFTSLALVLHELTTNSAKYGSLSDSTGRVLVTLTEKSDGALRLQWKETGGPPVQAPTRRGFGSTVIERSIPFELKGSAEIHYRLTGVEADFTIPTSYVSFVESEEDYEDSPAASATESAEQDTSPVFSGRAMVLEDNMIIALDAEELLEIFGFSEVVVVSTVSEALNELDRGQFDFALLDVNLGGETSEAVARAALDLGLPFAFATGYGDAAAILDAFDDPQVIQKPFDQNSLKAGIRAVLENS